MNIVVICIEPIDNRPPVVQIIDSLTYLGHSVVLISRNMEGIEGFLQNNPLITAIDLGTKKEGLARFGGVLRDRRVIHQFLEDPPLEIDLVWAATDISAREASSDLLGYKYVVQLPELIESMPKIRVGHYFVRDKTFPSIVRRANAVVVPEYNRAHIQKTWWDLSKIPTVLPNKSEVHIPEVDVDDDIARQLSQEEKKILLYQGGFTNDRDLRPVVKSLDLLDGSYALYLMGPILNEVEKRSVEQLCEHPDVHYLGFVKAPRHLAYTRYGYIGLLPYVPSKDRTRASCLNALYCAPNKVWEYAKAGLPMLGSDVPGLTSLFNQKQIGVTAELADPKKIAEGIREIERRYEIMSDNSAIFYKSVNPTKIIKSILDDIEAKS